MPSTFARSLAWLRSPRTARLWVAAYAGAIFVLSSIPARALPGSGIPHLDKYVHFVMFGGLGFLVLRAIWMSGDGHRGQRAFWPGVLFSLLYGLCDELHQSFTPGRDSSLGDWLADASGVLAGMALLVGLYRFQSKRRADRTAGHP